MVGDALDYQESPPAFGDFKFKCTTFGHDDSCFLK
jgi:hypothetical protein